MKVIDGQGLHYSELNKKIKKLVREDNKQIIIKNVNGQRYLGCGLKRQIKLEIDGVPGNDMAAFSSGLEVVVSGNGQDGIANTMDEGKIIIYGNTGDILGYSMRGGRIYVKGNVGYRVGIHMKGYRDKQPLIVVGGTAGDFLGEYLAGGSLIVLGLNRENNQQIVGNNVGVGMHGGVIYVRGEVNKSQVGREVEIREADTGDYEKIEKLIEEYCRVFELDLAGIMDARFVKLSPASSRPYGNLYSY